MNNYLVALVWLWLYDDWLISTFALNFIVDGKNIKPVSSADVKFRTTGELFVQFVTC